MKKWLSVEYFISSARASFLRFPLVLMCAALATFLSIYQIELSEEPPIWLLHLVQTASLGLPLFLALNLYLQRARLKQSKEWIFFVAVGGLLVIYYYTLSDTFNQQDVIRFFLWWVSFHLLVSFAPYFLKNELNGFWQFNQMIFLRFLTAVLYSSVLYIGISIALLAIDQLFEVRIDWKIYTQIWLFIIGVFNTWFFLSGVPSDFEALEVTQSYPNGLKLFTQFVLLPLVSLYLLILYVYGGKILFTWDLPKGWVTYLVLAFSSAGIFSLLLVYPIQRLSENRWIRIYVRAFYLALFPLLILLFIAIIRRIYDYGFTELRYLVLILSFWLTGIAVYFLTNKIKNIQYIPLSLSFLAFFFSFGPWGIFSVAEQSQLSRWNQILTKHQLAKTGKIQTQKPQNIKIPQEDWENMESIVSFLAERERLVLLQNSIDVQLDTLFKANESNYQKQEKMILLLSNVIGSDGATANEKVNYTFSASNVPQVWEVRNYDYVLDFSMYNQKSAQFELDQQAYLIENDYTKNLLSFKAANTSETIVSFDLNLLIKNLLNSHTTDAYNIPMAEMTLLEQSQQYSAKIEIYEIGIFKKTVQQNNFQNIRGRLFIKLK